MREMISPEIPKYDQFGRFINNVYDPNLAPTNFEVGENIPTPIIAQEQPINYTPVDQPQAKLNRIPISPVAIMPEEQALIDASKPINQRDPQFKIGRLGTVLNAIAAGLAGASGGPKVGMEVGEVLKNRKYNKALAEQQRNIELLLPQVAAAKERRRVGEEEVKLATARSIAEAGAERKAAQTDIERRRLDTQAQDIASKVKHREMLDNYTQWKQQHPKESDLQWLSKLPPEDREAAMSVAEDLAAAKAKPEKSLDRISEEAAAKARGTLAGGGSPESLQTASNIAATKAEATTSGRLRAYASPFGLRAAQSIAEAKSTGNYLTANIKDTMEAARHGLIHMDRISNQIYDMEREGKLGPLMSKWSDFMAGTVGTDHEAAVLRFNIGLMDTLLAKAHGGAKGGGSPTMLKHFQDLLSSKTMDAKTLRATLEEAKIWLRDYALNPKAAKDGAAQDASGFSWDKIKVVK